MESGDDGIVFKSSYTLNRLDECRDIKVCICVGRCYKLYSVFRKHLSKVSCSEIRIYDIKVNYRHLLTLGGCFHCEIC